MAYTFNQKDLHSGSNEPLEAGEYEVVIEAITPRVTPNTQRAKLSVQLRVRDDVDQPSKNRVVFDDVWSLKDDPSMYNPKKINAILGTQEIEDGRVFESIKEVIDFAVGGLARVKVSKELDDYRNDGTYRNSVRFYDKTKHPRTLGKAKPSFDAFDDDKLPF